MHIKCLSSSVVACLLLLGISAIACTEPSRPTISHPGRELRVSTAGSAFLELAADLVIDHGRTAIGQADGRPDKIVVIDTDNFWPAEPTFFGIITRRLDQEGYAWVESDLHHDLANMPGQFEESPKSGFRVNSTHVLLSVGIESEGEVRTLEWSYYCGELCSSGMTILFRREKDYWVQETVTHVYS